MKYLDHLLTVVIEEASEVIKDACKAQRFGMGDKEPGQDLTNEERFWNEANDFVGTLELVRDLRGFGGLSRDTMEAKKVKVKKYAEISFQIGQLDHFEDTSNKLTSLRDYFNMRTPS
jgi:hypothetical protein